MAKNTFPTFVPPMMANSAKEPFDSPDWIFEVKLDGYRGIAVFDAAGKPHRWSRNGLSLEKKFPAVAKALSKLKLRSTRRSVRPARFHRQRKGPSLLAIMLATFSEAGLRAAVDCICSSTGWVR